MSSLFDKATLLMSGIVLGLSLVFCLWEASLLGGNFSGEMKGLVIFERICVYSQL